MCTRNRIPCFKTCNAEIFNYTWRLPGRKMPCLYEGSFKTKCSPFHRRHFLIHILVHYIDILLKCVPDSSINNYQALAKMIVWHQTGLVSWSIYASFGRNYLKPSTEQWQSFRVIAADSSWYVGMYSQTTKIERTKYHQIPPLQCFLSRLAVVFAQSIEASWSTIVLPA